MSDKDFDEINAHLQYDANGGKIYWRKGHRAGREAGYVGSSGYARLGLALRKFNAHRVAWLLMTRRWPPHQIDHINGVRTDNRWVNLRAATHQQNRGNEKMHRTNKTGFRGVPAPRCGKWRAQIVVNGRAKCLGTYDTPEKAGAAYDKAAIQLYGEFYLSAARGADDAKG